MRPNKRTWLSIALLYFWWFLLSGTYLWKFWHAPYISGADASGHVAALHLYATHIYPDIQGWLPEFFGGMPFPVFYPPLFYWLGATLIAIGDMEATLAAKIITILAFVALPGTLFGLCRRLGLSVIEALFAAATAGVIACGLSFVALYAVGLLGLFEIGLYTHTLGFLWFCLWCGALPHARRSRKASSVAVFSLAAMILTNIHVLPLGAAYGVTWFVLDSWRTLRSARQQWKTKLFVNSVRTAIIAISSIMIASIWWLPLIEWHPYALGQPQSPEGLFAAFGLFHILWLPCILVVVIEWRRRPALTALCISLLLAAIVSLIPIHNSTSLPFQPWRLISSSILLTTIPTSLICTRMLRELLKRKLYVGVCLTLILVFFAWSHTRASFDAAGLSISEAADVKRICDAMKQLPSGMVIVEIIDIEEQIAGITKASSIREQNASRVLIHRLAMDGRPVIWSIFREHAVSAPLATATRNLFSTTAEKFGISGLALEQTSSKNVDIERSVKLAQHLGGVYYLVKTQEQVLRLKKSSIVSPLWEIGGWHLFASNSEPSPFFQEVSSTPIVAWLPAHFRNRQSSDFDFFNLSELLAVEGRPDICILWALSSDTETWTVLSNLPRTIVILDPAVIGSNGSEWLTNLTKMGMKLNVLLLDDGSKFAQLIHRQENAFAVYERIETSSYLSSSELMKDVAEHILSWQSQPTSSLENEQLRLWRTNITYFPTWKTTDGKALWLTGQGGMAIFSSKPPLIRWSYSGWSLVGRVTSLLGLILFLSSILWSPSTLLRRSMLAETE